MKKIKKFKDEYSKVDAKRKPRKRKKLDAFENVKIKNKKNLYYLEEEE